MVKRNILAAALFAAVFSVLLYAEPLVSPSWGYRIDLPEEYQYSSGDGRDKFSFQTPGGANFELAVYPPGNQAPFSSVEALAADVKKRLNSSGETSVFEYRNKKVVLLELEFSLPAPPGTRNRAQNNRLSGWGLCMELEAKPDGVPLILALAYGDAAKEELQILYFSALDSLAPAPGDQYSPGPITEFTYPRGNRVRVSPFGLPLEAFACEHDPEGAQALVDREFEVLQRSADKPNWKEAWTRFYRAIYRDSFSRLSEIAFALERHWAASGAVSGQGTWDLAGKGLAWVQTFSYERDLLGSDFVNLVSAAIEGRGDCDSRAMLWAIIMEQANIPAAIMVSADYGHAMGLIDIPGVGARFEWDGKRWLVAETTAAVALGRIGQRVSDPTHWLGIIF